MRPTIHCADVLDWAAAYQGEPFHALLCDPPYHLQERVVNNPYCPTCAEFRSMVDRECRRCGSALAFNRARSERGGFMGKTWDGGDIAFRPETWRAFWPLLHPGAFGMAFAGSRGWHRMAVAIEDAGYIIHPTMFLWGYGSGFPKATRIDTQIDAAAGVERQVVGRSNRAIGPSQERGYQGTSTFRETGWEDGNLVTAPATDLARAWAGHRYGLQAIKPSAEPIIVFQKPYAGRPVDSITQTGAGALWIDGGRIGMAAGLDALQRALNVDRHGRWPSNLILQHHELCEPIGERRVRTAWSQPTRGDKSGSYLFNVGNAQQGQSIGYTDADGYETITAWRCVEGCAVAALGAQSGDVRSAGMYTKGANGVGAKAGPASVPVDGLTSATYADAGNAARFFYNADWQAERLEAADAVIYQAKASTAEREAGLSGRQKRELQMHYMSPDTSGNSHNTTGQHAAVRANVHPTIKPIALAEHLARLLLPPALYAPRRLFVPFAGAGSECIGAMRAGWEHVEGVELEEDHVSIARARIDYWAERGTQPSLFEGDE